MHGLGNDFVLLDLRDADYAISTNAARLIADRHVGIGCDQLILIEPPTRADCDVRFSFLNADGSRSGACGNGTRCAASLILTETARSTLVIETDSGMLQATAHAEGLITIDMGLPRLDWRAVPLAFACDTLSVDLGIAGLGAATCVSMGNPHATFFVEDADSVDLQRLGPIIEHHATFPERVNVGIASLIASGEIRLRVWERGAGETLACGSGACAAFVAAVRRGLCESEGSISLPLGKLDIAWQQGGSVLLTGPVATSFVGTIGHDLLID